MKTITRDRLFELLNELLATYPELEHVIENLKTKQFEEATITPPKDGGTSLTITPIYTEE